VICCTRVRTAYKEYLVDSVFIHSCYCGSKFLKNILISAPATTNLIVVVVELVVVVTVDDCKTHSVVDALYRHRINMVSRGETICSR